MIDIKVNGEELSGIPDDVWARFKEAAARQFPQTEPDLAWAAYLSEVIIAGVGSDGENISYFMTKVPMAYAQAAADRLSQVSLTWDQFHAMFLRAAQAEQLKLANFRNSGHNGMFIVLGIDPAAYHNAEAATGASFERVMATAIASAAAGTLAFAEGTKFLEPKPSE